MTEQPKERIRDLADARKLFGPDVPACPVCDGTGLLNGWQDDPCEECGSTGVSAEFDLDAALAERSKS